MKAPRRNSETSGFTLLEVLVAIGIVLVLMAMLMPSSHIKQRSNMVMCMSNQKQIGIGLTMFHQDHGDKYPWELSVTNGGSMEVIPVNHVFPYYQPLSEYLNKRTQVLVCPTDTSRHPAADFSQLADTNISYFLNLDVSMNSKSVLGGDRHLQADGKPVGSGSWIYSTNMHLSWTRELHGKNGPIGVVPFGDSHVQAIKANDLNRYFRDQPAATNRLVIP